MKGNFVGCSCDDKIETCYRSEVGLWKPHDVHFVRFLHVKLLPLACVSHKCCLIIVPHDVRTNSKLRTRTWPQKEAQSLRMLYLSDMLHCEGPGPLWTVLPRAPGRRGTASLGREIEAERRGPWRGCTSPQPPPLGICVRLWEDSSDTWQKVLTVFRRLCRDFLVREMARKELGNFGIWNTANRFWTRCV